MLKSIPLRFCLFLLLFGSFWICTTAQTLEARYKIFKTIYSTTENGMQKNVATLQLDGFLYQKKNRFIYFEKPLYLDKYPDGYIDVSVGDNHNQIGVVTDSIQNIQSLDFDSLISRSRIDISGGTQGINVKQKLRKGVIHWQFFPDTKEINGLKCQKAQFINVNGLLQWVVWFCPDVPALGGPGYISELPGLVVEGENKILNKKFVLISYNSTVSPPDDIFWPQEFNQPFRQ